LIDGFKDASWTVRDAACASCSGFITSYPNEALVHFEELKELFISHLSDNIQSVRENTAVAVANVAKVYSGTENDILGDLEKWLNDNIEKARE